MARRISRPGKPSRRRSRRSPARALAARERDDKIVSMRLRGASFSTIGDALGLSASTVCEAFWNCLNRIPQRSVEQYRLETLQRLEVLREMVWKTEKHGRLPVKSVALLVVIESQRCKLMGLNAVEGFDPNAPPPLAPDRDAAVRRLQDNLSADELRLYVSLLRKAQGLPPVLSPAIETTAQNVPVGTPSPAPAARPDVAATARSMVVGVTPETRQPEPEPEPPRYSSIESFARETNQHLEDPLCQTFYEQAAQKWARWHGRYCADPKTCTHYKRWT